MKIEGEGFLSVLFTQYFNMFKVLVENNSDTYHFSRDDVTRSAIYAFCPSELVTPAKAIAKINCIPAQTWWFSSRSP